MKRSLIEEIYAEYVNSGEYAKMYNECDEAKDCVTAYSKFVTEFEDEDIFNNATTEYEKYGFIMGFKLAMKLKKECGIA